MKKTFIQLIDDHKIWNLDLEDLIYAESDRNYTHFHLVNGKTKTIVISLNKVMAEINSFFSSTVSNFKRVGRFYIVNLAYIDILDQAKQQIVLKDFSTNTLHCSRESLRELGIELQNRKKNILLKQMRIFYEITADSFDGLSDKILEIDGVECVDLELPSGRKWAIENLEAPLGGIPEMFAWGETTPKRKCKESNYRFGNMKSLTKYTATDGLKHLQPEDDAATCILGKKWRTPTVEDFQELIECCEWQWCIWGIYHGCLVTGKNGNSIFLHAGGCNNGSIGFRDESQGSYWTSSLSEEDESQAYRCCFSDGLYDDEDVFFFDEIAERCSGMYIRPVTD